MQIPLPTFAHRIAKRGGKNATRTSSLQRHGSAASGLAAQEESGGAAPLSNGTPPKTFHFFSCLETAHGIGGSFPPTGRNYRCL